MRIVVDDRERRAGVLECLEAAGAVTVEVGRLCVGDYLVDDRLLFERKTLPDLVASLLDGRLFRQASRLVAGPYRGIYILEGVASDLLGCGVHRAALQGAIVTLSVVFGLPVLRSMNPAETARLIRLVADQARRMLTGGIHRPGRRPRGKRQRELFILQGLPGVGPARAAQLLDTLGSVEAVFQAGEPQLAAVPGIGRLLAARIRAIVAPDSGPAAPQERGGQNPDG